MKTGLLSLIAITGLLAACSPAEKVKEKAEEKAAEAIINGAIAANGGNAKVDIGAADPEKLKMLPAYLPPYPGAEIVTSMTTNQDGKIGGFISLKTKDPVAKVMTFYREKVKSAGQTIGMDMNSGGSNMLMISDKDGKSGGMVTATEQDGETQVTLAFGQ